MTFFWLLVGSLSGLLALWLLWLWHWRTAAAIERAEAEAWRLEQESITPEERAAAAEMLMDTLARSPYLWPLPPDIARRAQSKAYAQAAVKWKAMGEELNAWRDKS